MSRDGWAVVGHRGSGAGFRLDRIAEFRFQPLVALFRAIEHADPRTFLDEARDDRTAESRRPAGYECDFAVKPAHLLFFALSRIRDVSPLEKETQISVTYRAL